MLSSVSPVQPGGESTGAGSGDAERDRRRMPDQSGAQAQCDDEAGGSSVQSRLCQDENVVHLETGSSVMWYTIPNLLSLARIAAIPVIVILVWPGIESRHTSFWAMVIYAIAGLTEDVAHAGGYAYVAAGDSGLRVIDVSLPSAPSEIAFVDTPGTCRGVDVIGDHAFVADGSGGHYFSRTLKEHELAVQKFQLGKTVSLPPSRNQ